MFYYYKLRYVQNYFYISSRSSRKNIPWSVVNINNMAATKFFWM